MKQFLTILKFEYLTYAKNKIFLIVTLGMVLLMGLGLSLPRFTQFLDLDKIFSSEESVLQKIAVEDQTGTDSDATLAYFKAAMPDKDFILTHATKETLIEEINKDTYLGALILTSPTQYEFIIKTLGMTNTTQNEIHKMISSKYQVDQLQALGIDSTQSTEILSPKIEASVIQTGKDQTKNFLFTYILIFALYMVIIIYGQFVASSVASEKSTRTMEVLITSAKPINLIFGKVFGACFAGLTQMALILGSSILFFNLNQDYFGGNALVETVFNIPVSTILYALLFFLLGYFMYSFIFGALGSLVSKVEDLGTATMPITLVFIASFMVVMFSMSSGNLDSPLMVFASYFPLSSPMAMFSRITMGDVKWFEILISILILLGSTFITAYYSSKIYKAGVLLYGKPPKITKLLKKEK